MIWGLYRDVKVTFSLLNRTTRVRVADDIDEGELRTQLDHARTLRFTKKEMIWLGGNNFYGRAHIFDPKFLAWLADFSLPEYELRREDGQYVLQFAGPWTHTTMWEIPALAIINELRSRAALRNYGPLHPRRRLCAGEGQAVVQGRAAAAAAGPAHLRFRNPAAARFPVAALVRRGAQGRIGRRPHRHQQRAAGDGQRPRGDRHQRPRAADGAGGHGRTTTTSCAARPIRCCATGSAITPATC